MTVLCYGFDDGGDTDVASIPMLAGEQTLKAILRDGRLAAAFDVFAVKLPQDTELLSLPNFLVTPHSGGSAHEAILAMERAAIEGLKHNQTPATDID